VGPQYVDAKRPCFDDAHQRRCHSAGSLLPHSDFDAICSCTRKPTCRDIASRLCVRSLQDRRNCGGPCSCKELVKSIQTGSRRIDCQGPERSSMGCARTPHVPRPESRGTDHVSLERTSQRTPRTIRPDIVCLGRNEWDFDDRTAGHSNYRARLLCDWSGDKNRRCSVLHLDDCPRARILFL